MWLIIIEFARTVATQNLLSLQAITLCLSVSHQRPARIESQRETEPDSGSNDILYHACVIMFCNVGISVWR